MDQLFAFIPWPVALAGSVLVLALTALLIWGGLGAWFSGPNGRRLATACVWLGLVCSLAGTALAGGFLFAPDMPLWRAEYVLADGFDEGPDESEPAVNNAKENGADDCAAELDAEFIQPKTASEFLGAAKCDPRLYDTARKMWLQELTASSSDSERDRIRGMITATYYGAGLHREGLDFLCDAYRDIVQRADHRYRFQVHAHLRRIALNEGRDVAVALARHYRETCGRDDFSPVWAYAPLGWMEDLNAGRPRLGWASREFGYGEDSIGLAGLIKARIKEPDPFLDHAYWMLGDYGPIITDFPNSYVGEVALAERAAYSPDDVEAMLDQYVTRYPNARERGRVVRYALREWRYKYGVEAWTSAIERYANGLGTTEADILADKAYETVREMVNSGRFADAVAFSQQSVAAIESQLARPASDGDKSYALERLKGLSSDVSENFADMDSLSGKEVLDRALKIRKDLGLPRAYKEVLRRLLTRSEVDDDTRGRTLYLFGRASLTIAGGSYAEAQRSFQELYDTQPRHALADDALTELGWIELQRGNPRRAIEIFDAVVAEYRGRNAEDNALWQKAEALDRLGLPERALAVRAQIVILENSDRIKRSAEEAVYADEGKERISVIDADSAGSADGFKFSNAWCGDQRPDDEAPSGTQLSVIGGAPDGSRCHVEFTKLSTERSFGLGWVTTRTCPLRIESGAAHLDGVCESSQDKPDAETAVARARKFGFVFLKSNAHFDSEQNQWQEAVVVDWVQEGPGKQAGIAPAWRLISVCGVPLDGSLLALGTIPTDSTCRVVFDVPDMLVEEARPAWANAISSRPTSERIVSEMSCRATIEATAVRFAGRCRPKGSILDVIGR